MKHLLRINGWSNDEKWSLSSATYLYGIFARNTKWITANCNSNLIANVEKIQLDNTLADVSLITVSSLSPGIISIEFTKNIKKNFSNLPEHFAWKLFPLHRLRWDTQSYHSDVVVVLDIAHSNWIQYINRSNNTTYLQTFYAFVSLWL